MGCCRRAWRLRLLRTLQDGEERLECMAHVAGEHRRSRHSKSGASMGSGLVAPA